MEEQTRRAIAFMAAARIVNRNPSFIYSLGEGRYIPFTGNSTQAYDYEAGAFVSGNGRSLYHYGTNGFIDLSTQENSFSGFDYASGGYFSGRVSGSSIQIFDHSEGSYFDYRI